MKRLFSSVCLLLVIAIAFSSCSLNNAINQESQSEPEQSEDLTSCTRMEFFQISVKVPTLKPFSCEEAFNIEVGIRQGNYEFPRGSFVINAEGFEITDEKGNTVTDRYECEYDNLLDLRTVTQYENFTLRLVDSSQKNNRIGIALKLNPEEGNLPEWITVSERYSEGKSFYAVVEDGKIRLTFNDPEIFGSPSFGSEVPIEAESVLDE